MTIRIFDTIYHTECSIGPLSNTFQKSTAVLPKHSSSLSTLTPCNQQEFTLVHVLLLPWTCALPGRQQQRDYLWKDIYIHFTRMDMNYNLNICIFKKWIPFRKWTPWYRICSDLIHQIIHANSHFSCYKFPANSSQLISFYQCGTNTMKMHTCIKSQYNNFPTKVHA